MPESWRHAAGDVAEISPLEVSPELSEFARAAVRSNATDREQLLSLIDAILGQDGIGLSYDPDATLTASEAFSSGTGNCLGFSNLFIATARDLGLNAQYELVNHQPQWQRADNEAVVGTLHVRVTSLTSASRMVFDFYPLPLRAGHDAEPLSDSDARAHHLNNLAADALRERDNELAYAYMYRALQAGPDVGFIWSNLGVLLARNDMDGLAESAYRQALAISPEQLNALSNLQRLYYKQERTDDAAELQARLDAYRQANPYYHASLGDDAYTAGDYEAAVGHFKTAIDLKKSEPEFYTSLSRTYAALGLHEDAAYSLRQGEKIQDLGTRTYRERRRAPETGSHIPRR